MKPYPILNWIVEETVVELGKVVVDKVDVVLWSNEVEDVIAVAVEKAGVVVVEVVVSVVDVEKEAVAEELE